MRRLGAAPAGAGRLIRACDCVLLLYLMMIGILDLLGRLPPAASALFVAPIMTPHSRIPTPNTRSRISPWMSQTTISLRNHHNHNHNHNHRRRATLELCLVSRNKGTSVVDENENEREATTTLLLDDDTNSSSFFFQTTTNDPAMPQTSTMAIKEMPTTTQPRTVTIANDNTINDDHDDDQQAMTLTMMALIFVVGSLSSLDRVAMSVALVPMSEEMGYSDTVKGSISSLFSVGYGLGILPSGLLIASMSPRLVMTAGIAVWSLGTLVTPWAVSMSSSSNGIGYLLAARALVGASESVAIPTVQRLLSNWIPPAQKSLAVATVFAGFQTGTILAYSLSPYLMEEDLFGGDWRSLFYVYGGMGLLYLAPWLLLAKDSPAAATATATATTVKSKGLDLIGSSVDSSITTATTPITTSTDAFSEAKAVLTSAPWKGFWKSKGVWAMFFAHAANNWGLYNNLAWTPTFYSEQYGLNVKESAILLVVPSIVGAVGGLSAGVLADKLIQNVDQASTDDGRDQQEEEEDVAVHAITNIRKGFQGMALFGPSLCMATLSMSLPEDPVVAQRLFAVAVGLQSFNAAGYGAANQEKAGERWTGLLYGITSLPSVMMGTLAVYLTGQILDATDQNWSLVFGLNAVVYFLGATAFVTLYDSKREFD